MEVSLIHDRTGNSIIVMNPHLPRPVHLPRAGPRERDATGFPPSAAGRTSRENSECLISISISITIILDS